MITEIKMYHNIWYSCFCPSFRISQFQIVLRFSQSGKHIISFPFSKKKKEKTLSVHNSYMHQYLLVTSFFFSNKKKIIITNYPLNLLQLI